MTYWIMFFIIETKANRDVRYVLGRLLGGGSSLIGVYADYKVLRPWVDKVVFNMLIGHVFD